MKRLRRSSSDALQDIVGGEELSLYGSTPNMADSVQVCPDIWIIYCIIDHFYLKTSSAVCTSHSIPFMFFLISSFIPVNISYVCGIFHLNIFFNVIVGLGKGGRICRFLHVFIDFFLSYYVDLVPWKSV